MKDWESLRRALRGSLALTLRQGGSALLGALHFLVVVRLIGPEGYGVYYLGLSAGGLLAQGAMAGVPTYLVRSPGAGMEDFRRGHGLLLLLLGLGLSLAYPLGFLLAHLAHQPGREGVLSLSVGVALLPVAYAVPLAFLERNLAYGRVALLELLGQTLSLGVASLLALKGWGSWAPALGHLAYQGTVALGVLLTLPLKPSLPSRAWLVEALGFALPHTLAALLAWGRLSLSLTLAGRFLGEEGLGLVALGHKVVDYASAPLAAGLRVAFPLLSRWQGNPHLLRRALEEGGYLLGLAAGVPLVLVALFGPHLLRTLTGEDLEGLEPLLSVLGLGQAVYGAFALEGLTLLALGRVWAWSALQGGYTLLSLLLVGGGSAWGGVEGYAWGHLASLSVFLLPQRVLRRALGKVGMGERVKLLASLAPLFFPWALGPWTLGALPVGLALMARQLGKARRTLQDLWRKGA